MEIVKFLVEDCNCSIDGVFKWVGQHQETLEPYFKERKILECKRKSDVDNNSV
jgi:hypothetical protein